MKIGIDPGHGGFDPGAVGPTKLREKDVVLAISLELARILRNNKIDTMLTREIDVAISGTRSVIKELQAKTGVLNSAKCDLAISVHCNSSTRQEANYISTFIQAEGGEAEKLAQKVQNELVQATGWPDGGVRVKNLHMTRETKMPAILCECGFISNPEQERQLRQPETQKKIAQAIADGVLAYLGIAKGDDNVQDVKVLVKGKELPGKLIDGQTYVPIRALIETLNNQVVWDEKDRIAVVK